MKTKIKIKSPLDYKKIKGLTFIEAKERMSKEGKSVRIVRKDKKKCGLMIDVNPSRLNVELEKGKISKVLDFG